MTLSGHSDFILNIQFFKDTHIFSCSKDLTFIIWDYINGTHLKTLQMTDIITTFIINKKTNELIATSKGKIFISEFSMDTLTLN